MDVYISEYFVCTVFTIYKKVVFDWDCLFVYLSRYHEQLLSAPAFILSECFLSKSMFTCLVSHPLSVTAEL